MQNKKILIVTKFFHPDITPRAFRAFELAKGFSRKGHEVTVLTTKREFDYSDIEQEHNLKIKAIVKNEPKQLTGGGLIKVIRFGLNHFFLYPFIHLSKNFKNSLEQETCYDIIISVAYPYPVHFGVAHAKKKNPQLTKTWVADCGDPFTGGNETRFKTPFYYKMIERWFCKQPDYITIPIKEAKSAYPILCHDKLRVIPQGFDYNTIKPNYTPGVNKVITFAYAGTLGPGARDPSSFINYIQDLGFDFKFILYTRNKSFLKAYEDELGGKLELRDYIPRDQLLNELGKMDFLVNLENRTTIHSPSKLIDYALLRRPILSIKSFDLNKEIINEFMTGDYKNSLKIENIEEYDINNVVNNFLKLENT